MEAKLMQSNEMFNAYCYFMVPTAETDKFANEERIKGKCTKQDKFMEVIFAPHTWKVESPFIRDRVTYYLMVCLERASDGQLVAQCRSPPFSIGTTKSLYRAQKRTAEKDPAEVFEQTSGSTKKLFREAVARAWMWVPGHSAQQENIESDMVSQNDPESTVSSTAPPAAVTAWIARAPSSATGNGPPSAKRDNSPEIEVIYPDVEAQMRSATGLANQRQAPSSAQQQQQQDLTSLVRTGPRPNKERPAVAQIVAKPAHDLRISIALILWLPPFGFFGLHQFYLGRTRWALASMFTLNLAILGWIADAFRLPMLVYASNTHHDKVGMSKGELYFIWLILGLLGGHHYATGNFQKGTLYTFTLGLFGIGWILDLWRLQRIYEGIATEQ